MSEGGQKFDNSSDKVIFLGNFLRNLIFKRNMCHTQS